MNAITSIPVLMYHHVSPHAGDTVTVTPAAFAAQMDWLARSGFRTLTLADLAAFMGGKAIPSGPSVVLTFDDGWLDNYLHAFPVLQRHGFHGVFFLVTDRVDHASSGRAAAESALPDHAGCKELLAAGEAGRVVLTWDLVREMAACGRAEFHSHTAAHLPCDSLAPGELEASLLRARDALMRELGASSDWLCWPYGRYSESTVAQALAAGYHYLCTTEPGRVTVTTPPSAIPRLAVNTEDVDQFVRECGLLGLSFTGGGLT